MPPLLDLPVTEALPAVTAALNAGRNAVLVAPPGAGKTTIVPLALLEAPWRNDGRILMLEPRRLATRAAATRRPPLVAGPPPPPPRPRRPPQGLSARPTPGENHGLPHPPRRRRFR